MPLPRPLEVINGIDAFVGSMPVQEFKFWLILACMSVLAFGVLWEYLFKIKD